MCVQMMCPIFLVAFADVSSYTICHPNTDFFIKIVSTKRRVSGHDLSVLPEMTLSLPKGNRGLRSRAVTDKGISSLRRRPARSIAQRTRQIRPTLSISRLSQEREGDGSRLSVMKRKSQ